MRKTYRKTGVKEYWTARWDAVDVDAPMKNINKYPLSCSLDAIGDMKPSSTIILEAGCGTGRLLRYFHELGYDIKGIDFIDAAILKIKELKLGLKAEVGDITNLRFKDKFFTHVLAFGLYHNFEEQMIEKALIETHRVMKDRGVLCASFRADNFQNFLIDKFFSQGLGKNKVDEHEIISEKQFHKINLTKSEIRNFIIKVGFKITKIYEVENMPILYKIKFFRHHNHKDFNEVIARRDGYLLNSFGLVLQGLLRFFFRSHFCNLYIVLAEK